MQLGYDCTDDGQGMQLGMIGLMVAKRCSSGTTGLMVSEGRNSDRNGLMVAEGCSSGTTRPMRSKGRNSGMIRLMMAEGCNSVTTGLMMSEGRNSGMIGLMVAEGCSLSTIGLIVFEGCNWSTIGLMVAEGCSSGTTRLMVAEGCNSGTIGLMVAEGCSSGTTGLMLEHDWTDGVRGMQLGTIGLMVADGCSSVTIGLMGCNSGTTGLMVSEGCNSGTIRLIVAKGCILGTTGPMVAIGSMVFEGCNSGTIELIVAKGAMDLNILRKKPRMPSGKSTLAVGPESTQPEVKAIHAKTSAKRPVESSVPDQVAASRPEKRVKIAVRNHKSHHGEGGSRQATWEKEPEVSMEDSSPTFRRPKSMKDLCDMWVCKDDEGYYVLQMADWAPSDPSATMQARWPNLSYQVKVWDDPEAASEFDLGVLNPTLAKDLYTLPSELLITRWRSKSRW
ncbi:hypothetical protein BHM03_00026509 [Ensete ventricosum]|nr:hypothetical protein BHM03_00026509 [Ensete ventricosum]